MFVQAPPLPRQQLQGQDVVVIPFFNPIPDSSGEIRFLIYPNSFFNPIPGNSLAGNIGESG